VDGSLEEELSDLVKGLENHPQIKGEQAESGLPPQSSLHPTNAVASSSTAGTTGRTLNKAPRKPNPFPGSIPGSSGGYTGTDGHQDWAIEREMEILRLEEENASLRELLSIANELPVDDVETYEPIPESFDNPPTLSRKGSIAVEELEADAAREADEAARAKMLSSELGVDPRAGAAPAGQVEMLADTPAELEKKHDTGLVPDTKGENNEASGRRPILSGSMLGFQSEGPPPEHVIADEVEGEDVETETPKA
jgi:hypothetical protein